MNYKYLNMEEIDFTDDRFRISYFQPVRALAESILREGVIQPVVVAIRDGKYVLVCGWKRALAGRKIGLKKIPALVYDEENDQRVYLTALDENLSLRSLSLVEKAECLEKLRSFGLSDKTLVREYCSKLAVPAKPAFLDIFLKIAGLDEDMKRFISEQDISLQVVRLLLEFDSKIWSDLMPYLESLGQNKQKQLLEDLYEIGRRENISSELILKSKEILLILNNKNLSVLQKADQIRLALQKQRYPQYYSWKDLFESYVGRMGMPGDMHIDPSPFFEDDQITLKFRFGNREEYEKKLSFLADLTFHEEFTKLLEKFGHEQH